MSATVPIDTHSAAARAGAHLGAAPLPTGRPGERHLRPVATPAGKAHPKRSPLAIAMVGVAIILMIFAVQLGLSIAISQGAYESRALEIRQRDLSRVERVLSQNVDKLASPQNLAENAAALGMVQNSRPATLRLSDGAVLGALDSETTEASGNLIPNATLESMPVVDAQGLLVPRVAGQAAAVQPDKIDPPVRWTGKLPAPDTH
ncbi:hypothetical protein [Leucobacter sp. USHLN153]|uniref:hypothetical protein n=1 Tax=Leucobacter sp. USHLN153 TaxID=3081268 RepID=UPI0030195237